MFKFSGTRKDNGETVVGWFVGDKFICTEIAVSPFFSGKITYLAPCIEKGQLINKSVPMDVLVPRQITLFEVVPETVKPL